MVSWTWIWLRLCKPPLLPTIMHLAVQLLCLTKRCAYVPLFNAPKQLQNPLNLHIHGTTYTPLSLNKSIDFFTPSNNRIQIVSLKTKGILFLMSVHVCVCVRHVVVICESRRGHGSPLELELQTVLSLLLREHQTELAHYHWAISLAQIQVVSTQIHSQYNQYKNWRAATAQSSLGYMNTKASCVLQVSF